jgi:hypothetical protein
MQNNTSAVNGNLIARNNTPYTANSVVKTAVCLGGLMLVSATWDNAPERPEMAEATITSMQPT